jgi:hypothetical protein
MGHTIGCTVKQILCGPLVNTKGKYEIHISGKNVTKSKKFSYL